MDEEENFLLTVGNTVESPTQKKRLTAIIHQRDIYQNKLKDLLEIIDRQILEKIRLEEEISRLNNELLEPDTELKSQISKALASLNLYARIECLFNMQTKVTTVRFANLAKHIEIRDLFVKHLGTELDIKCLSSLNTNEKFAIVTLTFEARKALIRSFTLNERLAANASHPKISC